MIPAQQRFEADDVIGLDIKKRLVDHRHHVAEIVAKVRPAKLEQVIKLVGWSPSCYRALWLTCNGLQQS
jgi:hypothetical protein